MATLDDEHESISNIMMKNTLNLRSSIPVETVLGCSRGKPLKNMRLFKSVMASAGILTLLNSGPADAAVLIEVDISNLSAVTFTATSANASQNVASYDAWNGVTLDNFFNGNNTSAETVAIGSLWALNGSGTGSTQLGKIYINNTYGNWSRNDVNFYNDAGVNISFNTSEQAFTGTLSYDLSGFTGFRTVGSSGDIIAGDPGSAPIFGQWQIIPEPSSALLVLASSLYFILRRRR